MSQNTWFILQRFAEGGDGGSSAGGEGANTGVTPDNPGRARLLELGVPEGKISKRAEKAVGKWMDASAAKAAPTQVAAAEQEPSTEETKTDTQEQPAVETPKRMTWKEITSDPEYAAELQKTIQGRLKKAKGAEETLSKFSGAFEVLARKYGMDAKNLDYGTLAAAIEGDAKLDTAFYEKMAQQTGTSIEVARAMDQQNREAERKKQMEEASARDIALAQHFASMEQQAEQLKQTYPNFDLRTELQNERFAAAVGPGGGLSVEQAYTAFHWQEIQAAQNEVMAKKLREEMAKSVQSNRNRPQELGASGAAPSVTSIDWRKATPEQLREMNERVRREGKVFR